jgi:hypothetical protein
VLVGFILGFALVGVFRFSVPANMGPQLTAGQALHRGAAVDQVAHVPCPNRYGRTLILV